MTTNELLDVAMQAMPISVLAEVDQGQVYGVLSLALMLQEAQHAEQLRIGSNALRQERDEAENESRRWQQTIVELNAEIAALKAQP